MNGNNRIIDRDIEFYEAQIANHRIDKSAAPQDNKHDALEGAALRVVVALRAYRILLDLGNHQKNWRPGVHWSGNGNGKECPKFW